MDSTSLANKGLVFTAVESYGTRKGNYWQVMLGDIIDGLREHGTQCHLMQDELTGYLRDLNAFSKAPASEHPDFLLTLNLVENYLLKLEGQSTHAAEAFMSRPVTICIDNPTHIAQQINAFQTRCLYMRMREGIPPPAVWGIMDNTHRHSLNDLGIGDDRIFMFPQAGPTSLGPVAEQSERNIDFLFMGTIGPLEPEEQFLNSLHPDRDIQQSVKKVIEEALENHDPYLSMRREWLALGRRPDIAKQTSLAKAADLRARVIRRYRLLNSLAKLKITFCGNIDPKAAEICPNAQFLGALPFTEVQTVLSRSKILINDTINLQESLLMRAYYAMAQGCVVATETNRYVHSNFQPEQTILCLGKTNDADYLIDCVSDKKLMGTISESAKHTQQQNHRWANRVPQLLKAIQYPGDRPTNGSAI